jgi:Ca2+-binding RTX toxin-like protein
MLGGTGNDTFTVENVADSVIESANEGFDTVNSFISYTLTANVERLILEGFDNLDGTGNALDNTLNGNNANNHLIGGLGNDTLQGKGGADLLEGGLGDDLYYIDNMNDVVIELDGQGTDKVSSSISYALSAHVEQLFLTGLAGLAGTGNTLNNIIYGNEGNNQLTGDLGDDSLNGGSGNDILVGGEGNDTLVGSLGNDTYVFGIASGRDTINNTDTANGNDTVLFDADISANQLWLRQLGNDLEVSIMGTANSINVQNWYSDTAKRVDGFALADGKTLLANEVQTLVEAMAAFAAPALGQTSLTTAQHTVLDSVIAASW